MSQSRGSSRETQALVQSMLQRLKLQAGTEIQGGFLPASPTVASHDWGQNRDRAPHQQTLGPNSRPVQNGFGIALVDSPGTGTYCDVMREGLPDVHGRDGRRWDSREEFRIPTLDSNLDNSATGAKVIGEQGLFNGPILDSRQEMARLNSPKAFSSTSCKDNTAGNIVESGGTGQMVTFSAVSGCLFPVNTQHFAKTNYKLEGGKEGNGNSVIEESVIHDVMSGAVRDYRNVNSSLAGNSTSASQYPSNSHSSPRMTAESRALSQTVSVNQYSSPSTVRGFSPRVFAWSLQGLSTGRGEIPTAHQENEDSGPLAQSQDVEIGSKMPSSTSAPLQRNRAYGSKTKRWTQKIKEKFKERGGGLKKRKEEAEKEKEDIKVEEEGKISTQDEYRNTNDASRTLETTSKPTDTASRNLEDSAVEMRSNNDFDIGLGSFSLLEEIKTGQYWANFLSPALSDISTSQRPAKQHEGQSNIAGLAGFPEDNQSSGSVDQLGNPGVAVMATSPADLPVPAMDTSELDRSLVAMVMKHVPRAEPMEQHSQSDGVFEELGPTPGEGNQVDLHFIKNAGIVNNPILKSQIRNRKRAHRWSLERTGNVGKTEEGGERDVKGALQDKPLFSSGLANGPATVKKEFAEDHGLLYLYPFKSHQRPSLAPREFVPKGVLKHTQCTDSESSISMETAAKKRRMEAGCRVRFSEEVVAIPPMVFDISMDTDSEEESQQEENSETGEENGTAQGPWLGANETDEAPARPPTLPGWIRALKRKSGPKSKR
ncbi:unnamed protein product [Lota lota]